MKHFIVALFAGLAIQAQADQGISVEGRQYNFLMQPGQTCESGVRVFQYAECEIPQVRLIHSTGKKWTGWQNGNDGKGQQWGCERIEWENREGINRALRDFPGSRRIYENKGERSRENGWKWEYNYQCDVQVILDAGQFIRDPSCGYEFVEYRSADQQISHLDPDLTQLYCQDCSHMQGQQHSVSELASCVIDRVEQMYDGMHLRPADLGALDKSVQRLMNIGIVRDLPIRDAEILSDYTNGRVR